MRSLKTFLLSLIDSNDSNSSKRFSGLIIVFTSIGLAITATIKSKGLCPDFMFNSLLIFAGCCFGFNMAENILKGKNQSQIDTTVNTNGDVTTSASTTTVQGSVTTEPKETVDPEAPGSTVVDNPDA